jgi:hypothetical protein
VDGNNALIVTDGSEWAAKTAASLAAALKGFKIVTVDAKGFAGSHLLPADVCFFGAEAPKPKSFKHLETVLQHINLAGRACGFFAPDGAAADYLRKIAADTDIAAYGTVYGKGDIKAFVKGVAGLLPKKR